MGVVHDFVKSSCGIHPWENLNNACFNVSFADYLKNIYIVVCLLLLLFCLFFCCCFFCLFFVFSLLFFVKPSILIRYLKPTNGIYFSSKSVSIKFPSVLVDLFSDRYFI